MKRLVLQAWLLLVFPSTAQPQDTRPSRTAEDSAGALTFSGDAAYTAGTFGEALTHFSDAYALARGSDDLQLLTDIAYSIGATYRALSRADSAFHWLETSLNFARRMEAPLEQAYVLNTIGALEEELGTMGADREWYERAEASYRSALRTVRDSEGGHPVDRAQRLGDAFNGLGVVFRRRDQIDSAFVYYRQAEALQRQTADTLPLIMTQHNFGLLHRDRGVADSALAYLHGALDGWRTQGLRRWEAETLFEMGVVYHHLRPQELPRAVAYYDSALTVFQSVLRESGGDANRLGFAERIRSLIEHWSLAELSLQPDPARALDVAEQGRAQGLLHLRGVAEALSPTTRASGASTGRVHQGLYYLATQDTLVIWGVTPNSPLVAYRQPLARDSLNRWIASIRRGLGADEGRGFATLLETQPPTTSATRSETVGSEAVGAARGGAWPSAESVSLADALLPAVLLDRMSPREDLVLFPDGSLNSLPFAALPVADSIYLGLQHRLRFSPSLRLLQEARTDEDSSTGVALVVGDPSMPSLPNQPSATRLPQLDGARNEASHIAALFGTEAVLGPEATETRIRELLPTADVIHLATHGFAYSSDSQARESWVALAPDSAHDGFLTVGEILDELPGLRAELVSLSACETGLGNLKQAEGSVGLQRAFLARGAESLLVSLWKVSDKATDLLMRSFYRHWQAGRGAADSKADALRYAQRELRRAGFDSPSYWASFQLVGMP